MRGTVVFILLLLIIGFFAVASEAQVIRGEATPVFSLNTQSTIGSGGKADFVPQVDRADDPAEILPCTAVPHDCSLRSALTHANDAGTGQQIRFTDHFVINLTRPLPPITREGTHIIAQAGQEVRINGNNQLAPVLHITAPHVHIEGLRLFGAGPGYPNLLVNGQAHHVVIARNLIGDDDAPEGNCGQNSQAAAGIAVQTGQEPVDGARAWIYGNIIECHTASPGDALLIKTDGVRVGVNPNGQAGETEQNTFRHNQGVAVRLGAYGGNTIRNNLIHHNAGGAIEVTNFTNNILENMIY